MEKLYAFLKEYFCYFEDPLVADFCKLVMQLLGLSDLYHILKIEEFWMKTKKDILIFFMRLSRPSGGIIVN